MPHKFVQLDVFTDVPLKGNPLAVVYEADDLSDEQMARFANWTNLSETTFILKPSHPEADYRVRIFTPTGELPFAGHPTLGTCFAWLKNGGQPKAEIIVQECATGLVHIRRSTDRLYFAAPKLVKNGSVDPGHIGKLLDALSLEAEDLIDANWMDNGPGWVSLLIKDVDTLLKIKPNFPALGGQKVGLVASYGSGDEQASRPDFELRAFTSFGTEDPVTGSLNAGVAQWLISSGRAPATYLAGQGRALGRDGRIFIESAEGQIWVGGNVCACIEGEVDVF